MIILNYESLLVLEDIIEDNNTYVQGKIIYADGEILDIGKVIKGQGNFLYDENYVYRWRIDKEYPSVYNIHDRKEVIDKEVSKQLINKYKKFI